MSDLNAVFSEMIDWRCRAEEAEAALRFIDLELTVRMRAALGDNNYELDGDGSTASLIVDAIDRLVDIKANP
jgi:hypothetical protein